MKEITLEAAINNIRKVTDWVDAELESLGCPPKTMMQIDVAIDELFTNIASYAYPQGTGTAVIRFEHGDGMVSITFEDEGIPYDPLQKPDPDVTLSAKERKVGGLGVFLVKNLMDSMEYQRKDGRNVVTIRKRIAT